MDETYKFNTPEGQTVARELLIAYLNVGDKETPDWAPVGKRVEDSSMEFDWAEETIQDILGNAYTTAKKPTVTQTFDPLPLDAGDKAAVAVWKKAIYEQNPQALTAMDMLIGHWYTDKSGETTKHFAERYDACFVRPTGLGGEGGGSTGMPLDVTYGGVRTLGTVSRDEGGKVTFAAGEA